VGVNENIEIDEGDAAISGNTVSAKAAKGFIAEDCSLSAILFVVAQRAKSEAGRQASATAEAGTLVGRPSRPST